MTSLRALSGCTNVGLGLVQLQQPVAEVGQPEEVVRLAQLLRRRPVDRAQEHAAVTLDQLAGQLELLAGDAVEPLVGAFVHLVLVTEGLPELAHPLGVPFVGGADEVVVAGVDDVEHRQPLARDQPVGELLRRLTRLARRLEHLLPVLVGAGQEEGLARPAAGASERSCPPPPWCTRCLSTGQRSRSRWAC
jgi:hypothetical protein